MKKFTIPLLFFILPGILIGCNSAKQASSESLIITSESAFTAPTTESSPMQDSVENNTAETTVPTPTANNAEEAETIVTEPAKSENESATLTENESSNTSQPAEIPAKMELKKVGNLQYYLYSPKNPTTDMPLIIYLHGGTNKKAEVTALLTTDGFPKYLNDGYYGDLRAYVAIPKLDDNYKGWADIYDQIRTLVKELNQNNNISTSKVALTGHSMGGTGAYQLQVKLPNTFACVAPMSGSIKNTKENLDALSKTKIWAFIGTDDTIVDPESSRTIIAALQDNGANAQITELNGATHFDVPSLAYKNQNLIQWLVRCGK